MTLLAYEATRDVRVEPFDIETPVAPTTGIKLSNPKPLIVPILRAGLGMLEGMVRLLPSAEVGFLGMQRNEETLEAITYANRLPGRPQGSAVLRHRPDARHRRHPRRRHPLPRRPRRRRHHGGHPAGRARGRQARRGGPGRPHHPDHHRHRRRWTSGSTRRATSCPASATRATASTASSDPPPAVATACPRRCDAPHEPTPHGMPRGRLRGGAPLRPADAISGSMDG